MEKTKTHLGGATGFAGYGLAVAHGLVLGPASLELVSDSLVSGLLKLLLEDSLHEHTLVLVHVTLALLAETSPAARASRGRSQAGVTNASSTCRR